MNTEITSIRLGDEYDDVLKAALEKGTDLFVCLSRK